VGPRPRYQRACCAHYFPHVPRLVPGFRPAALAFCSPLAHTRHCGITRRMQSGQLHPPSPISLSKGLCTSSKTQTGTRRIRSKPISYSVFLLDVTDDGSPSCPPLFSKSNAWSHAQILCCSWNRSKDSGRTSASIWASLRFINMSAVGSDTSCSRTRWAAL